MSDHCSSPIDSSSDIHTKDIERDNSGTETSENSEIDLHALDIIKVDTSDEDKEPDTSEVTDPTQLPFFDYMPDEVLVNIYSYLSEQEILSVGQCCKRFYELLNEETVWDEKARGWANLRVSKANVADKSLREYYTAKYKQNKDIQKQKDHQEQLRREQEAQQEREFRKYVVWNVLWLSMFSMEIPLTILIFIWTIFLALRADDTILWDYHRVFSPMYLAHVQFFCGLVAGDCIKWNKDNYREFLDIRSLMTLILRKAAPLDSRRKFSIYWLWMCSFLFFLFLAQSLEDSNEFFSSGYVLIPIFAVFVCLAPIFCSWCSCRCRESTVVSTIMLCITFWVIIWAMIMIYLKSESYVSYSWAATFSAIWGVFIALLTVYIVIGTLLCLDGGNERKWCRRTALPIVIAFILIVIWLILMTVNLDKFYSDEPTWPWVYTCIPLYIFLCMGIIALCGIGVFAVTYDN
eukprot:TRINITY_DN4273_c0_g1_i2.p1 TRINITY_DN4273_c0_g1~~TRINITY_DN4273_c0_g1_i2.p1  ORF type:complete len:462 (-),score=54.09 TRINITY_DN4273_c0_g1_i2:67-1452(-)